MVSEIVSKVVTKFQFEGELVSCEPFGNGHINDTYALTFKNDTTKRYILQRINTDVFKNPIKLMENISKVIGHIALKVASGGGDCKREVLNIIQTVDGCDYFDDVNLGFWRAYDLVESTIAYDQAENDEVFRQSAIAFGKFQKQLADFPAEDLFDIIPNFHNTKKRYDAFEAAVLNDAAGRAGQVAAEIEFAQKRKADTTVLMDLLDAGKLPLRVTHNDTKLNNVLIDRVSGKALCVIDLDTVMPGLAIFDFGDSIRFGASTAAEDEKDLSKVSMSLNLFKIYAHGFLSEAKDTLTPMELEHMAFAAKIMTYECGIRFLADYLNGDKYFKISYPDQNLDRCRTQFKLVADMEDKMNEMERIIRELTYT